MKIKDFRIRQIPREENKEADALANLTSAFNFISDRSIPLKFLPNPSIEVANPVYQTEVGLTWMDNIIAYLWDETLQTNKLQACRIRYRSVKFCLFHGILYKGSFSPQAPLQRKFLIVAIY